MSNPSLTSLSKLICDDPRIAVIQSTKKKKNSKQTYLANAPNPIYIPSTESPEYTPHVRRCITCMYISVSHILFPYLFDLLKIPTSIPQKGTFSQQQTEIYVQSRSKPKEKSRSPQKNTQSSREVIGSTCGVGPSSPFPFFIFPLVFNLLHHSTKKTIESSWIKNAIA